MHADSADQVCDPVGVQVREPIADHRALPALLFEADVLDRPLAELDPTAQGELGRAAGMRRPPRSVAGPRFDHRQRFDRAGHHAHPQGFSDHGHATVAGRAAQTVSRPRAGGRGTDRHGAGPNFVRSERPRQAPVDEHPARRAVRPEAVRPALHRLRRALRVPASFRGAQHPASRHGHPEGDRHAFQRGAGEVADFHGDGDRVGRGGGVSGHRHFRGLREPAGLGRADTRPIPGRGWRRHPGHVDRVQAQRVLPVSLRDRPARVGTDHLDAAAGRRPGRGVDRHQE